MPMRKPDDEVGSAKKRDSGEQTAEQAAVLGGGGETKSEGGITDAERNADWTSAGGEAGRAPAVYGGNSQGQGDRMSAKPGQPEPATNAKTRPGEPHES